MKPQITVPRTGPTYHKNKTAAEGEGGQGSDQGQRLRCARASSDAKEPYWSITWASVAFRHVRKKLKTSPAVMCGASAWVEAEAS